MQTLADARAELSSAAEAGIYPELTDGELDACLKKSRRFYVRENSASFEFGQDTYGNGRLWRCVTAGILGAAVPSYPSRSWRGRRITDGTATFEDVGTAPAPLSPWDMGAAIREAWLTKERKASGDFDINDPAQDMKRSQVVQHCRSMANRYGWRGAV